MTAITIMGESFNVADIQKIILVSATENDFPTVFAYFRNGTAKVFESCSEFSFSSYPVGGVNVQTN